MPFTIATWNISSVRLREPLVLKLLAQEGPDILCLQECKSPTELIPTEKFAAIGYRHMMSRGQKGYNGVLILSKWPIEDCCGRFIPSAEWSSTAPPGGEPVFETGLANLVNGSRSAHRQGFAVPRTIP